MVYKKVLITDDEYPSKLKKIYNPPSQLFVLGNVEILNNIGIAIIGSRNCSKYGIEMSQKFAYEMSKSNINIISGLARGIDTHAHIGCIKAKNKTIAVLGSGFNNMYPPENINLVKEILKFGGAVVTEYFPDEKPNAKNFPMRNRIISGLSDALLVIEATRRSGTSITVDYALNQGKEVYALPGNINQLTSFGTNELIKQGAKPITSVQEIIEDFKQLI